jgi:hypothetical protein
MSWRRCELRDAVVLSGDVTSEKGCHAKDAVKSTGTHSWSRRCLAGHGCLSLDGLRQPQQYGSKRPRRGHVIGRGHSPSDVDMVCR